MSKAVSTMTMRKRILHIAIHSLLDLGALPMTLVACLVVPRWGHLDMEHQRFVAKVTEAWHEDVA